MATIVTTDKGAVFEISDCKYGRKSKKLVAIDYFGNEFSIDSLWSKTLDFHKSSNVNMSHVHITLIRIFSDLIASPTILKTLQAPLAELTSARIRVFLSLLDDVIDRKGIAEDSKYQYSQTMKRCFCWPELKLGDNGTLESCYRATKPRFSGRKKQTTLDIAVNKTALTSFKDLEELNDLVTSQYQQKIDALLFACKSDIDRHFSIVNEFTRLKNTPLSDRLERRIKTFATLFDIRKSKIPPDPFHLNARIVEVSKIIDFETYQKAKSEGRKFYASTGSEQIKFYCMSSKEVREITTEDALFCDLFLPRRILLACLICLQLATSVNVSTLLTLERCRIEKTSSGKYNFVGIKTKTNKLVSLEVTKQEHPVAFQAIELLLVHDLNISKYWKRTHQSIFCSMNVEGERDFDLFQFDKVKNKWINWHGFEHFAFDDLRDLTAQHDYLSHKDPFRVQALLQHANIAVTDDYLECNVISLLRAANINEFMRRLAPSIAFSVDKDNAKIYGFNEEKIDHNLLFPVSKFDGITNAISDKWLMSTEGIKFSLDEDSIAHCGYQKSYYLKNFDSLMSANKERFLKYHLPRILFCMALHGIIKESEYKHLLVREEGL